MLPALLPAEQAGLMLPLVGRSSQHQCVLFPDAAAGQIESRIGECPAEVQPLIIFIDPKVEVEVGETSVPVVAADGGQNKGGIKDYLYDLGRGQYKTLTPAQIEAFEAATVR